jgi:hypothetical protein
MTRPSVSSATHSSGPCSPTRLTSNLGLDEGYILADELLDGGVLAVEQDRGERDRHHSLHHRRLVGLRQLHHDTAVEEVGPQALDVLLCGGVTGLRLPAPESGLAGPSLGHALTRQTGSRLRVLRARGRDTGPFPTWQRLSYIKSLGSAWAMRCSIWDLHSRRASGGTPGARQAARAASWGSFPTRYTAVAFSSPRGPFKAI